MFSRGTTVKSVWTRPKGFETWAIEAGRKRNPSLEILKRLARALGVPVAELL